MCHSHSNPAAESPAREVILMKTLYFLAIVALGSFAFSGCATDRTETTETRTDQTTTRVHSQDELKKTGESDPGRALEKVDPSVQTTGNR